MNTLPVTRYSGFSLVELMIGIVIMGILATVAVPSFLAYTRNSQIRNAAESVANGLQRARAEAIARNTNVAFTLGINSSWTVSVVAPASVIEQRLSTEGSTNVTLKVVPEGKTAITFNNLGQRAANADASEPFTQVDLAATGGSQNLRVTIGVGGNTRMCDPNLAPSSSPRAC